MNSLGWSRRVDDEPVNTSQQSGLLSSIKSLNPFGDRGYVRLPTTEGAGAPLPAPSRREEEEGWFACEFQCLSPLDSTPDSTPDFRFLHDASWIMRSLLGTARRSHVPASRTSGDLDATAVSLFGFDARGQGANFWAL